MSDAMVRFAKGAIGVVIVVALLIVVSNWWGDYKSESSRLDSVTSTGTVTTTRTVSGETSATTKFGVVLIEGLNFRKAPDSTSATLRGLKKGEKLIIVGSKDEWYHVKDSTGATGWVTAKPQYVQVEK